MQLEILTIKHKKLIQHIILPSFKNWFIIENNANQELKIYIEYRVEGILRRSPFGAYGKQGMMILKVNAAYFLNQKSLILRSIGAGFVHYSQIEQINFQHLIGVNSHITL
jgi:hypothetical protein